MREKTMLWCTTDPWKCVFTFHSLCTATWTTFTNDLQKRIQLLLLRCVELSLFAGVLSSACKEGEGEGRGGEEKGGEGRGGEEGSQTKSRGTSRKHIGTKLRHGGASIARRPGRRWRSSGAPTLRVLMFGRAAAGHPARGIRRRGRRRALLELWVNRARCQRAKRTRWTLRGPNLEGI